MRDNGGIEPLATPTGDEVWRDYRCEIASGSYAKWVEALLSCIPNPYVSKRGRLESEAYLGLFDGLAKFFNASERKASLRLDVRVTEAGSAALPRHILATVWSEDTETGSQRVVASWVNEYSEGEEPCWLYREICK